MIRSFLQKISGRKNLQVILKTISYLVSEKFIKLAIGFIVHALLVRYLGSEHFGKLSYLLNFTFIFVPFAIFGMEEIELKHLIRKPEDAKTIILSSVFFRTISAVVGVIVLLVVVYFDNDLEFKYKVLISLYSVTILLRPLDIFEVYYHSKMKGNVLFWGRNLGYTSSSVMKYGGILFRQGISFFVAAQVLELVLLKIYMFFNFLKDFKDKAGSVSRYYINIIWMDGRLLFLNSFIVILDSKLPYLFLKERVGDAAVGDISIAIMLVELWNFLPIIVVPTLLPAIINAKDGRSGNYDARLQLLYDFIIWLGVIFSIAVTISSELVIAIVYGKKFIHLADLLSLSCWMSIFNFLNLAKIKIYSIENRYMEWFVFCVITLILNIIGHSFLVDMYQAKGALYSIICSQILGTIINSLLFPFSRKQTLLILKTITFPLRFKQLLK